MADAESGVHVIIQGGRSGDDVEGCQCRRPITDRCQHELPGRGGETCARGLCPRCARLNVRTGAVLCTAHARAVME